MPKKKIKPSDVLEKSALVEPQSGAVKAVITRDDDQGDGPPKDDQSQPESMDVDLHNEMIRQNQEVMTGIRDSIDADERLAHAEFKRNPKLGQQSLDAVNAHRTKYQAQIDFLEKFKR